MRSEDDRQAIARVLRRLRRERRLKQPEVAELVPGLTTSKVSQMERGASQTQENLRLIARAYETTLPRLLEVAETEPEEPPEVEVLRWRISDLERQIAALERGMHRDLPAEELYRLRQDANDEGSSGAKPPPPAPPESGSRSKRDHPPSRSGRRP